MVVGVLMVFMIIMIIVMVVVVGEIKYLINKRRYAVLMSEIQLQTATMEAN